MITEFTNRLAAALAETRATVREQNRMSWEVLTDAADRAVSLRAWDDWLLLEASLDASACAASIADAFMPEQLAMSNATLPGGAKFGVDARFNLTVRAEVPLIEDTDPGPRALEALHGVLAGLTRFASSMPEQTPAPSLVTATVDLKALAAETGWAFTERDNGRITFELPSPNGALTATLHTRDACAVRVWVSLAELTGLSTPSRQALAVLLLRAGAVLRFARPAFVTEGEATSACLEVVFATAPVAAELIQALESLAVGVAMAAAEASFLCQNQIALEYLAAVIGPRGGQETTTTPKQ
jgi:hypothetical protein